MSIITWVALDTECDIWSKPGQSKMYRNTASACGATPNSIFVFLLSVLVLTSYTISFGTVTLSLCYFKRVLI
uniref:Uncharacterized protein n=1 Tax=Anguilla anguilla TaxID=7936 RepID=A0A0E9QXP5_ANGAN